MSEEKKYIYEFVKAVYPEAPDLALQTFNEKVCLEDATERIKALEQQLKEKEESLEAKQNAIDAISFNTIDLSKKLSEAETRVKELEVSVEGIQSGGRNIQREMVAKMNELEAENKRLRDVIKTHCEHHLSQCDCYFCEALTALNESEKDKP